jgi:hypothetical protein
MSHFKEQSSFLTATDEMQMCQLDTEQLYLPTYKLLYF